MRDDAIPVAKLAVAATAIVGAIAFALVVVLHHRRVPAGGAPVAAPPPLAAGLPVLETAPQVDLATYESDKRHALHDLGWVDAASGVAHIPIETAMAMRAASGASR